jgi:hypothetical protein
MSSRETPESGLFTGRAEFYQESTTGQFNSDPSYKYYSDEVIDVGWTPNYTTEARSALGTGDAAGHDKGMEQGEIEIVYRLQRQLVDGNGDPDDPAGDAWDRDSDNRIKNTHGIRIRDDRSGSDPDDPSNASGARIYVIGQGGHPDADMELDPQGGGPVEMTISYSCEKVRIYEVFQPPGDEALDISSSDTGDTSQTLTIEDDNGNSEDVSLNGTTTVTTTKSDWDSIRALELDSETSGDVTISLSTSGDTLATLRGADAYAQGDQSIEGDLGIPAIGSGSLASAVNNSFEYFNGATVTRGGSSFSYDVNAGSAEVDNNYETNARHGTFRPRIDEGNRDASAQFDFIGWGVSPDFLDKQLRTQTDDLVIGLSSTDITLNNSTVVETDDVERGPDDSAIAYAVTFEPSDDGGVSLSQP